MESFRKIVRVLRTPVTLILLLCVLGYGAKWGYDKTTEKIPERAAEPCTPYKLNGQLTPNLVRARVLNGGERGGLAKSSALILRAYGFNVIKINNTEEKVTNTVIVGNSADDPEVRLMQLFFKDATTRGDGRVDHVVDVLLGDDSQTISNPKVKTVDVNGEVCLAPGVEVPPATPSPTPTKSK